MKTTIYLKCFGAPQSAPSFGASIVLDDRARDYPIVLRAWGEAEQCSGRMRSHLTGALVAMSVLNESGYKITSIEFVTDEQSFAHNAQTPASRAKELDIWTELDAALKGQRVAWNVRRAEQEQHLQIAGAFAKGAKGGPFVSREEGVAIDNLYRPHRPTFDGEAA